MVVSDAAHRSAALDLLREALAEGQEVRVGVRGSCMEPLVLDGDRVWALALDVGGARVGDLLLALDPDAAEGESGLVCHRLLARGADRFVLAGDATRRWHAAGPEQVLGRIVAVERTGERAGRRGNRPRRLDRARWRALDVLQARLHRYGIRRYPRLDGRWVDRLASLVGRVRVGLWRRL